MSPEDQKKAQLMEDPDFAKIVKSLQMKAPLLQIVNKIKAEGKYQIEDLQLFMDSYEKAKVQDILADAPKPKNASEVAAEKEERK